MDSIIAFISTYISYWPLVCFLALLLAGINIPISEDVLIIMSAIISANDRSMLIPNYIGLYLGIYLSDLISYWFGRLVGTGFIKIKFVAKKLTPRRIKKITDQLDKHGFLTFVITRFIPFGVRNTLFMTSGLIHFNFTKFMLFDAIAAVISSSTLYWLIFFVGESAARNYEAIGIILFVLLIIAIIFFVIRHEQKKKKPVEKPASDDVAVEQSEQI